MIDPLDVGRELRRKVSWQVDKEWVYPKDYVANTLQTFFKLLKKQLPNNAEITLNLHRYPTVPKKYSKGTLAQNTGLNIPEKAYVIIDDTNWRADIHIALKERSLASMINSLAHEYWHIHQVFNKNIDLEKDTFENVEGEANIEGGKLAFNFRTTYLMRKPYGAYRKDR